MVSRLLPPRWATLDEVAEYVGGGIAPRTVRGWIRRGELRAVRMGPRLLRIDLNEVDRMGRRISPPRAKRGSRARIADVPIDLGADEIDNRHPSAASLGGAGPVVEPSPHVTEPEGPPEEKRQGGKKHAKREPRKRVEKIRGGPEPEHDHEGESDGGDGGRVIDP